MKKVARGLALTVVALFSLVPIQATPAAAFVGTLDVEPEDGGVRIEGSVHRLTATLTVEAPDTAEGETINFDTDGTAATAEETCTILATGSCSVTVSESSADGEVRAWVQDGLPTESPCGVPPTVLEEDCDSAEGIDEAAEGGDKTDPDDTDVVGVEFVPGTLDVEPEESGASPGGAVELTATVMSTETPPQGLLANVDAEILAGGPNANQVAAKADMECDTIQAGTCTLTYTAGPTSGVDEVQSWVDLNDDPGADPPAGDETSGAGFEGDASEGPDEGTEEGDEAEDDTTDVVLVNLSASQQLILSPASATKALGAQSALTATVTTGATPNSGVAVAGQVLPGGPHAGTTATCSTGANGQCTLNYTGPNPGTDKFRATVDADGNGLPNEADSTEDVGVAGGTPEPDTTAVAQITWGVPIPPDDDNCDAAKQKVKKLKKKLKKAKKAFKKAKASDDGDRIEKKKKKVKKLKKKVKKAKQRKRNACA